MNADSSAARVSFKLPVGGGFLNASATLPGGHTTLTQLLPVIQNLENAIVARVGEEAEQAGSPISCRAGCGACCRQMVPVSFFEADALAHWFEALPENRRAELERRFHSALLALREAGVIENLVSDGWTADEESATRLAIDYFHAGVACPFLENESCSIHPIRPLSCREYLVTSPPDLCSDPSVNQVAGVQLPIKLSRVLFAFGQRLAQDRPGWVPVIFLMAWREGGRNPGDYVSGTGEEVLLQFLKQVTEIYPNTNENSQPVEMPAGH
ncbi:MAG: YkgJ family cysteine cluster protein [Silvibacterium sp.]|nr:YkgJ family cysteine cluster protein [Silvibacterium sp.]